jgi:hypothetical protein
MTEGERIAAVREQAEAAVADYRSHFIPMEAAVDAALESLGLHRLAVSSPAKTDAIIEAMKAYRKKKGEEQPT